MNEVKVLLKSGDELIHIGDIKKSPSEALFDPQNMDTYGANEEFTDFAMLSSALVDFCEWVYLYNVFSQEEGRSKQEFYFVEYPTYSVDLLSGNPLIVGEKIETDSFLEAHQEFHKRVQKLLKR